MGKVDNREEERDKEKRMDRREERIREIKRNAIKVRVREERLSERDEREEGRGWRDK